MADCREGLINPSGEIEDSSAYNLNFSQINERGVVAYPYMNVLPLLAGSWRAGCPPCSPSLLSPLPPVSVCKYFAHFGLGRPRRE